MDGCTFKLNKFQSHRADHLRVQLSVGLEHLFSGLLDLKFEKDKYVCLFSSVSWFSKPTIDLTLNLNRCVFSKSKDNDLSESALSWICWVDNLLGLAGFFSLLWVCLGPGKLSLVKHLYMIDSLQVFSYTHFVVITRLLWLPKPWYNTPGINPFFCVLMSALFSQPSYGSFYLVIDACLLDRYPPMDFSFFFLSHWATTFCAFVFSLRLLQSFCLLILCS